MPERHPRIVAELERRPRAAAGSELGGRAEAPKLHSQPRATTAAAAEPEPTAAALAEPTAAVLAVPTAAELGLARPPTPAAAVEPELAQPPTPAAAVEPELAQTPTTAAAVEPGPVQLPTPAAAVETELAPPMTAAVEPELSQPPTPAAAVESAEVWPPTTAAMEKPRTAAGLALQPRRGWTPPRTRPTGARRRSVPAVRKSPPRRWPPWAPPAWRWLGLAALASAAVSAARSTGCCLRGAAAGQPLPWPGSRTSDCKV